MMTEKEFIEKLKSIKAPVTTPSGAVFININVTKDCLSYGREDRQHFAGKSSRFTEHLPIAELFQVYLKEDIINAKIVRTHINSSQYSPAVAMLKAANLYDKKGNRILNL